MLSGTTSWHLWALLPFVVLVAAYLPEAVSFAAGQAAFTVMVVILFNIIEPVGWTVGLVRIEDIALGCAAGLISGVLLWPRGAAAQIRTRSPTTTGGPPRAGASVQPIGVDPARTRQQRTLDERDRTTPGRPATDWTTPSASTCPSAARNRCRSPVLTAVSNGANRVRLAAEAIAGLLSHRASRPRPPRSPVRSGPARSAVSVGTASAAAQVAPADRRDPGAVSTAKAAACAGGDSGAGGASGAGDASGRHPVGRVDDPDVRGRGHAPVAARRCMSTTSPGCRRRLGVASDRRAAHREIGPRREAGAVRGTGSAT